MSYKKTPEERRIIRKARANRPACYQCGALMEPHYNYKNDKIKSSTGGFFTVMRAASVWCYGHHLSDSYFCTLRCAMAWAIAEIKKTKRGRL